MCLRALSHLPRLVRTFKLFRLVRTKCIGVKRPPDYGPNQAAEIWFDEKRWSRSGSNWTMVQFVYSVKTFFWWFGLSDHLQEVPIKVVVSFPSSTSNASTDVPGAIENTFGHYPKVGTFFARASHF